MMQTYRPLPRTPPDFKHFWQETLDDLASVDLKLERREQQGAPCEALRHENLHFHSFGGARIGGYALTWRDEKARPMVVHSHGYHSCVSPRWAWALSGLNIVGVDIRGFGRSQRAAGEVSKHGYMLTGIETPETHVLRGAICDYIRAAEVATRKLDVCSSRIVFEGTSFAGGLALMAESLTKTAELLAVAVPTFGWTEGRYFFVKDGSGAEINGYLKKYPHAAEDVMVVLRYFDPMSFAAAVTCPTLIGVGKRDDIVPAPTVHAIIQRLSTAYEVMEFPVSHSNEPEEQLWEAFVHKLIAFSLTGVPVGFGDTP